MQWFNHHIYRTKRCTAANLRSAQKQVQFFFALLLLMDTCSLHLLVFIMLRFTVYCTFNISKWKPYSWWYWNCIFGEKVYGADSIKFKFGNLTVNAIHEGLENIVLVCICSVESKWLCPNFFVIWWYALWRYWIYFPIQQCFWHPHRSYYCRPDMNLTRSLDESKIERYLQCAFRNKWSSKLLSRYWSRKSLKVRAGIECWS